MKKVPRKRERLQCGQKQRQQGRRSRLKYTSHRSKRGLSKFLVILRKFFVLGATTITKKVDAKSYGRPRERIL